MKRKLAMNEGGVRRHEPALDGIRGCAVAGVLIFHGGYLKGGYLGVDAFFVLSGFLITSLLLHEAHHNGRISLTHFWARRARRLLPALAAVMIIVAIYAAFIANTNELNAIRWDAITTLGYIANWRQVFAGVDYFALYNGSGITQIVNSPLNHTWSLAIEEQFYVFWPIIVYFLAKGRTTTQQCRNVFNTALILAITSMILAQILYNPNSTTRVYYGTDTRIAAILFGAILAAWTTQHGHATTKTGRNLLEAASLISLAGLAIAWTRLDGSSPTLFRGGLIAAGIAVTTIIAAGVHPQRSITHKILTIAPLRALGNISYGLYLWHVVIYVVVNETRTGIHGPALLALRLAITLAVSWASYQFIERPIRYGTGTPQFWKRTTPITTTIVIIALLTSTIGATSPYASAQTYTKKGGVLIVGDSTAHSIYPGLARANLKINESWIAGCRLVKGRAITTRALKPCLWETKWGEAVTRLEPSVVVLVIGSWDLFDFVPPGETAPVAPGSPKWNALFADGVERAIDRFTNDGVRLIIPSIPCFGGKPEGASAQRSSKNVDRVRSANAVMDTVLQRHPEVIHPDLFTFLCPKGVYQQALGAVATARPDGVHFARPGSAAVAKFLIPFINSASSDPELFNVVPTHPVSVAIYGDTYLAETKTALQQNFELIPFVDATINAVPLTALCDVNRLIKAAASKPPPELLLLADSGSSVTPCMRGNDGAQLTSGTHAYVDKYAADIDEFLALTRESQVVVLLAPASADGATTRSRSEIAEHFRTKASAHTNVAVSDAVRDSLGGDTSSRNLTCLAAEASKSECVNGVIPVRSADEKYLCPFRYPPPGPPLGICPVYSSGIVRYSAIIVRIVRYAAAPLSLVPRQT